MNPTLQVGRRRVRASVLTALLALLAGCSGSSAGPTRPSPAGTTASAAPAVTPVGQPALTEFDGCVTKKQAVLGYAPGSGPDVPVALLPAGREAVVLSEQSDQVACDLLPLAHRLHRQGYTVALWDTVGGQDPWVTLARVVSFVRSHGARGVELLGGSQGAKVSLIAAALDDRIDAVVSLSAEAYLPGATVRSYVRRLRVPTLLATAAHDPYASYEAARSFLRAENGHVLTLLVVPGVAHGTDLLHGSHGLQVTAAVLGFLRRHVGRSRR